MKHVLALLALLCIFCTEVSPAQAGLCVALQPDQFAEINWGKAEHYDSYTGGRILAAMTVIDGRAVIDLDLVPAPKIDELYALPAGNMVLIIRVSGRTLCGGDPVNREVFDSAKFWVLPAKA